MQTLLPVPNIKQCYFSSYSDYQIRCRPAHGFHHVLSMTGNMSEFTRVIKRQRISGNMDTPEGGLDAMLQAAVCQVSVCVCVLYKYKPIKRIFSLKSGVRMAVKEAIICSRMVALTQQ